VQQIIVIILLTKAVAVQYFGKHAKIKVIY